MHTAAEVTAAACQAAAAAAVPAVTGSLLSMVVTGEADSVHNQYQQSMRHAVLPRQVAAGYGIWTLGLG
jgi:hypothetical protein